MQINSTAAASRLALPKKWKLILLGTAVFFLLAAWTAIGFYLYFRFAGPVAPGVHVGPTELGGLTLAQAAVKIDNEWNRDRILYISDQAQTWQARPLEFGLWVDPDATARAAYAYGRGLQHWSELTSLVFGKLPEIRPSVVFNPQTAQTQLAYWAALVERAPQPPVAVLQNNRLVAVAGAAGAHLDTAATLEQMGVNYALIAQAGYLPLITQSVEMAPEESARQVAELQSRLDRSLVVQGYDPVTNQTTEWIVPQTILAGWLVSETINGQTQLKIDESHFGAYLSELEKTLTDGTTFWISNQTYDLTGRWQRGEPYTVILKEPATTYTVAAGDTLLKIAYRAEIPYWMIAQANPQFDPDALPVGALLNIPSKSDLLPEPVVLGKRIVISISQQHMTVYENGSPIREMVISTGVDRSPTQPGVYQVQTHEESAYASVWDLTMPNFIGIYEAWPGFMNGIHGLPTLSSGARLWASILGKPASYGCIILDLANAEWLYNWAETGVVVEIQA